MPMHRNLNRVLTILMLVAMGCAHAQTFGTEATAPRVPPAASPPEAQALPLDLNQAACQSMVRNGGAEFNSEAPTTDDRFPKLLELTAEASRCWEAGHISNERFAQLLEIA